MNKSSKFSLTGFLIVCASLFLMDWEATTLPRFEYNQMLGVVLVIGFCLTVVGGYLTRYDSVKLVGDNAT